MKTIQVFEHQRIERSEHSVRLLDRLQRFDEAEAKQRNETVFDWGQRRVVGVRNWVGVIEVPGLRVEILPKTDAPSNSNGSSPGVDSAEKSRRLAQSNLLTMLAEAGAVPVRERDLAAMSVRHLRLLEYLISVFAVRLEEELKRGAAMGYEYQEENLPLIKGKLLIGQHIRKNCARFDQFYCGRHEFLSDNLMNRVLKAGCRVLLSWTTVDQSERTLREILRAFEDVSDKPGSVQDVDKVAFNRNNERFRPLVEFCRLVFSNRSSEPRAGRIEGFSLLFPMETVFEAYVASLVRRHAATFGFGPGTVRVQAKNARRHLLRRLDANRNEFLLKPDILVKGDATNDVQCIADTKWKRLDPKSWHDGINQADLYQLHAYATVYKCATNVLVYPLVRGVAPKEYELNSDAKHRLRVAFVDLNRDLLADLREGRKGILGELKTALALVN